MTSSSASSIRIGSYHLGARIGEGGADEVYRAEGPAGPVAIQLLGPDARDLAARAKVQHPSLVRVIEHGVDEERGAYLVTALLVGRCVRDALDGRRVDPAAAIRLAAPIAAAVAALHAGGLVHGALTAERVFTTDGDEIVVSDRGLAWSGRRVTDDDAAADVRAIGVMIGQWANPPAGAALSALVASCLVEEPARRPTAAALAAQLEAMRDAPPPRRARWIRAALLIAAMGAVVAGAAFALTRAGPERAGAAAPLDQLPAIPPDQLPATAAPFDLPSAPPGEPIVDARLLGGRPADDVIAEVEATLAAHPDDRNARFGRAMVYLAAGREPRGLELLDEALRLHPDHAPGWSGAAYVEVRRGRWDAAEEAFARTLALDPRDGAALRNRGILRHRRGQVRDAYADLRAALVVDPGDVEAMYELIQLYARLERSGDTRALLEHVARLRPDHPQVWLDLSQLQPPAEALRSIRRALAIDPGSARGRQRLCDVLASMQDPGAAAACEAAAAP